MASSLTCPCGVTFTKQARKGPPPKYCSDICRMAARGRKSVRKHGHNGYKAGCRCEICAAGAIDGMRDHFRQAGGNRYRKPTPKVACEGGCGKMIRAGTCASCTPRVRAAERASLARRRRAQEKLRLAAQGSRSTRAWVQDCCGECGAIYLRRNNDAPFCSAKCRRREARGRRRALEAGRKVTPGRRYMIHERDNWTCKLCGFPVDRDAVVPALEAPVIDHVISLARGGVHGEDNWQTAHFYCNSYKRDLDMSEVA